MRTRICVLLLACVMLAGFLAHAPVNAAPTTPPPAGRPVLQPGQLPRICVEGDIQYGATGYNVVYGVYWSDTSNRWVSAPHCFPRWGFLSMSAPTIVQPGGSVTLTAMPEGNSATYIPIAGGASWSHGGTATAGCGTKDLTCTVQFGVAGQHPLEWQWHMVQVSAPSYFVINATSGNCAGTQYCGLLTTHAWTFVGIPPKGELSVDFAVAEVAGQPGTFDFSAIYSANGIPEFSWDFGGGATATGETARHTFDTAGTKTVQLRGEVGGVVKTATKQVEVAPPTIEVSFEGAERIGRESEVTIVLRAAAGVGDIVGVSPVGPLLGASPAHLVDIGSPDGTIAPFTLSAGGPEKRITVPVGALDQGKVTLTSKWRGTAAGQPVDGEAAIESILDIDELEVSLELSPAEFEIEEDAEGPKPREVTVTAKVKNTLAIAVHGVSADRRPTLATRSGRPLTPFPVEVSGEATPSDDLGSFAPGEEKTVTYTLTVTDDLRAEVGVFVIGTDAAGDRADGKGVADLTAKPKYDIYWDVTLGEPHLRGPHPFITVGESVPFDIEVRNLTTETEAFLFPVVPDVRAGGIHVSGGVPVDLEKFSPTDPAAPPYGGPLEPNRSTNEILRGLMVTVATAPDDHGFVDAQYRPRAFLVQDDGELKQVPEDRILFTEGSDVKKRIRVDVATEVPDTSFGTLFMGFSEGFVHGTVKSAKGLFTGLIWMAETAGSAGMDFVMPSRVLIRQAEMLSAIWHDMSDLERQDQLNSLIVRMEQQYGEPFLKAKAGIDAAVTDWFVRMDDAVARGDVATIGRMVGELEGELAGTVAIGELDFIAVAKAMNRAALLAEANLANRLAATRLRQAARHQQIAAEVLHDVRTTARTGNVGADTLARVQATAKLENGQVLGEQLLGDAFGINHSAQDRLRRWAAEGLEVTVTPAGAEQVASAHRVRTPLHDIVPVNTIDVQFLGARTEDFGSRVLREPFTRAERTRIMTNVRAQYGDDVAAAVGHRIDLRNAEFKALDGLMADFTHNGTPSAGGPALKTVTQDRVPAPPLGFSQAEVAGKEYYRVLMQPARRLEDGRVVLGEGLSPLVETWSAVDVRLPGGQALPEPVRRRLYAELAADSGAGFGEVLPGDALLATDLTPIGAGQLSALQRHRAGLPAGTAPPMAQFGPDGVVRAVRINMDASVLNRTGSSYLHYVGGYVTGTTPAVPALAPFQPRAVLALPLVQHAPSQSGDREALLTTGAAPEPGDSLVIEPNTPNAETVEVESVGPATLPVPLARPSVFAGAATRATAASTLTVAATDEDEDEDEDEDPSDDGPVRVQLTAPLAKDHPAGSLWVRVADVPVVTGVISEADLSPPAGGAAEPGDEPRVLPGAHARPQARGIDHSCPASYVGPSQMADVPPGNVHRRAIDCMAWWDIARGFGAGRFGPSHLVTRGQMASFLVRLIEAAGGALPTGAPNAFPDDEGSAHRHDIDRLAAAGIVNGRPDGTYGPDDPVTRAEMASLLVRVFERRSGSALPSTATYFEEALPAAHALAIGKAAEAGFTAGQADGTFGAERFVRRDQMASFLARVLDLLVEERFATLPRRAA